MGCGAGVQTAALLLNGAEKVTSVDKAPVALETAKQNLLPHFDASKIDFVESNLFENVKGSYHFMVFNPPYVPSPEMRWSDTDGGKKGREVIDQFLEQFHLFLSPAGTCYLLQSSRNSLMLTQEKAREVGFACNIVALQDVPGEELQVLKLQRDAPEEEEEEPQPKSEYYT
jgi:release factor glutamine methyltransferase